MKLQRKLVIILSVLTTLVFSFGISKVMQQNKYGEFDRSEQQRPNVAGTEVNIENDKTYEEKELASNASKRANVSELYTSQELDEAEPENKEVNNDEVENEETEVRTELGSGISTYATTAKLVECGTEGLFGSTRAGISVSVAGGIEEITFVNNQNVPSNAYASWDASEVNGAGEITAWMVKGTREYILYIGSNSEKIETPTNLKGMFGIFDVCKSINNLNMLDTSNATDMSSMFEGCNSLVSLDLSGFNTQNVTKMSNMFSGCRFLESVNLSSFDTSKVTDMNGMFGMCFNLTNLDVSNFDTKNVTNMSAMFSDCRKITSLDLTNFNTQNVTNMSYMFLGANNLTNINLSSFDTSKVTNMSSMFGSCSSLKAIILDKKITSSDQAMKLLNDSSNDMGLKALPNAILYVTDAESEKLYEQAENYSTIFADSKDANGDLYRIRPLLEPAGKNPIKVNLNSTYDATVDAGATIAGFDKSNASNYTQYGYNFTTTGLPVDTSTSGTKQVTYTLTRTKNGTTTNGMSATRNVNVAESPISVTYDANGGTFANGSTQNVVEYGDITTETVTKISKTSNVSDDGSTFTGEYGTNQATTDKITIPGAKELKITITYATESIYYDWVCVYDGNTIPSSLNYSSSISGKLGGTTKTTKTYTVTGDTVQFFFKSDSKNSNYYGYYAVVEGEEINAPITSGTYEEPTSTVKDMKFSGWYTDANCTEGNEFILEDIFVSTKAYAKYVESLVASGTTGGVSWKIYESGLLKIYPTNGVSGTMDNLSGYANGGPWNKYSSLITSVIVESGVVANSNIAYMFVGCSNLTGLDLSNFDTSNVTNIQGMFYKCSSLTNLDLSSFKTSNVTNMSNIFYGCSSLTNQDLSKFDTSKVTTMKRMFSGCSSLTNLDVSKFDTSNVTNMNSMFYGCSSLISLNVSSFNTSKVTDMSRMFSSCNNLKNLDLNNFDTNKVTDMTDMFSNCSSLINLAVSQFDTSNVTDMSSMFDYCKSLTNLDLSNFNTSKVTRMNSMFENCRSLTSLDVSKLDTSSVTNMYQMFWECNNLKSLDVSQFDTSKVTTMSHMFYDCINLTSLDVSNFNTTNVTDMDSMFYNCSNLTSLDVSNFDTSNVTSMGFMFYRCESLTSLDVSNFNTSKVKNMSYMFYACSSLTSLDLSNLDTSKVTNMYCMFYACSSLTSLDLSNLDTSTVTNMSFMFFGCRGLTSLDLSNFDTSKVTNMNNMFDYCSKLKAIILNNKITSSDQAMKLLNDSGNKTGLKNSSNVILYVSDPESEKLYEQAENYSTIFADSRDESGDLYRIRPILELVGDNPTVVEMESEYDETVDAGVTIAGFDKANASNYTQYGYDYTVTGLPVDTSTAGTKQITYTFTSTKNGTTTNGMSITRDVNVVNIPKLIGHEEDTYVRGAGNVQYVFGSKRAGKTKYTSNLIKTITFVNNQNIPKDAVDSWDASYTSGDNGVLAWIITNSEDTTKYDLYLGANDETIKSPVDSSKLFKHYRCTTINNLQMLDTSNTINMSEMFADCKVASLDLSNFNTINVTNMSGMFNSSSVTSLDLSNFNTTNVVNMSNMFYWNTVITNLNLSNLDTKNVTDMSFMFSGCRSLANLDVSNFNTSKVTNMSNMFSSCDNLTTLDLSNFDTTNVTDMSSMFDYSDSLISIDLHSFNTSNVTDMKWMFATCSRLTNLDVSNFNTSKVTNMSYMFYDKADESPLEKLDLSNFDTTNVTDMSGMFSGLSHLTNLDLSNFNTSNVTNMYDMFSYCENLVSIDLSNFNTTNVTRMESMFSNCSNLKAIILSNKITSSNQVMKLLADSIGLQELPNAILYVSDPESEKLYEQAENYSTIFADSRDESGDLYRVRPILELVGDNPVKAKTNSTYDETVDAGVTIAGFNKANASNYTQYGYNYTVTGLPVDTSTAGTKQVTYTLTSTKNDTTANGMSVTRNVIVSVPKLIGFEETKYVSGTENVQYVFGSKRAGKTQYTSDLIKTITFVNNQNVPADAVDSWDASYVSGDNEVLAWLITNSEDSTKYDLYLGIEDEIVQAPENSQYLFGYYNNCTAINNLTLLKTLNTTSMQGMFLNCSNLVELDVSNFDTSNVSIMKDMFASCKALVSLNLSKFVTIKVTDMKDMFQSCNKLTSLELGNFDTSNVTDMAYMFDNCKQLTELDISNFDTSNVTNMNGMFSNCSNLTKLDLTNFNTSKVTTMWYMFNNCVKLTTLDVSSFNTSNVTGMRSMFCNDRGLIELDVSNFNTSKVTTMYNMFSGCSKLTSLNLENFDTANVTDMNYMFAYCYKIKSVNLGRFNTSNLTSMNGIFIDCSDLKAIILNNKITSSDQAMKLLNNSNNITGLSNLPDAILYVPDPESEKLYEQAENYSTIFADSRDESGDLYRIRPILELAGDNPVKAKINSTYDETVDAGVTIAGFDKANESNYTQYGYNYTVTGLPVDTSVGGSTKQVTYTLISTKDGTTTNGMSVTRDVEIAARPVLMTPSSANIFGSSFSKDTVTKFVILNDSTNAPTNYVENGKWDVSAPGYEGSVYAYLVLNADGATYTLYVVADGTIEVTVGCDLFANYTNLTSIEGMEYLDTSKVTDMSWMFANSPKLTSIDISMFDTSSATDMTAMFYKCEGVTNINLSGIDTSKVTNMSKSGNAHFGMFESCISLISIDVSEFDTSNVTYMRSMFRNCQKLVSLDLRSFDTSSSPAMDNFLLNDGALKTLVLGSKVTNIIGDSFINSCGSLETIIAQNTTPINFGDSNDYLNGKVILYVPNASETDYEANTKLATLFGTGRIKPILALNGESDTTTGIGTTYIDSGAVVAGFDKANANEYMKYGYTLTSTSSVDTSKTGNYKVTYVLTYSVKGESTPRTETVVRNVTVNKPVLEAPTSANIFGSSFKKDTVTKIVIANSFDKAPSAYVENGRWDISATGYEGSVYAYLALNTDGTTHTLYIVAGGTIEVTNGCDLFSNFTELSSIEGMEYLDTSKVTDMSWMFAGSPKLTSIDISMLDTSSVTTMEAMFADCAGVTSINLKGINTTKVTNMGKTKTWSYGMFEGCSSLKNIELTGLDTSNVENVSSMFKNCLAITSINASGMNFSKAKDMNDMFFGCANLTTLNLTGTTASEVTSLDNTFRGCEKVEKLDLSGFDTSNVTSMNSTFLGDKALKEIKGIENFNTAKVTDMKAMFNGCESLETLNLRSFDTSNVDDMSNFLLQATSLKVVLLGTKFKSFSGDGVFNKNNSLVSIIAQSNEAFSNFEKNSYYIGSTLTSLYVPSSAEASYEANANIVSRFGADRIKPILQLVGENNIAVGQGSTYVDAGATVAGFDKANESYYTQYGYTLTSTSNVDTSKNGVYQVTYTLTYPVYGETTSRTETVTRTVVVNRPVLMAPTSANIFGSDFKKDTVTKIIITDSFDNAPTSHVANGYWDISAAGYEGTVFACLTLNSDNTTHTLYIIAAETIEVTNGCDLFSHYVNCTSIEGMENLNTSNVTDMSWMFSNSSSLTDIDISMLDTSKVTTMEAMFSGCKAAKNINLKGIDTSKVKYMGKSRKDAEGMFEGCTSLTNIDITRLNMDSLVSTSSMFKDCSSLTSIDFSGRNLNAVTNMNSMFSGCSNATTINLTGTTTRDITDLGDLFYNCSKLTDIDFSGFNTTKVTTITSLVNGCAALTKVDLSTFDTSNVIDMSALFNNATILKEIILGDSFTTGKVTDMSYMFNGCNALESIDLSNFDTNSVTTMQNMFWKCNSATQITFGPNFNTAKVTNMENMFRDCYALTILDLSAFDTTNVTTMNNFFLSAKALKVVILGEKFNKFVGASVFNQNNSLEMIIAQNPTAITITGTNYMNDKAILYVPTAAAEKLYESADGYATLFSSDDDTDDDIDRIRPILELIGDSIIEIDYDSEYVDAGATVLGYGSGDETEYAKYGYTLSVSGLPIDTSVRGKHEVKYTLNYTRPGTTTTTKVDEVIRTINIESADISNMEITLAKDSYVYTGVEIEPQVTVTNNGETLEEGTDYTVDYTDNIDVGTATVTITGIGNYTGTVTKNFEITPAEITGYVTISGDPTYGGQLHIDFSNVVPASAEFTFEWFYNLANSTEGGTRLNDNYGVPESNDILIIGRDLVGKYIYAQVTVTADNYNTKVLTAIIGPVKARNINELDAVLGQEVLVYDGNEKRPGVFIYDNYTGEELVFNKDYTLVYKDNVEVGTATVTITGDGDYTGERSLNFLIVALPTVKVENITPEWRANDTILQITIVDSGAGIHKVTFTGGTHSGDDITLTNNVATVTVDENGYYYFEVYDIYNNVVTGEALVNNIDKNAPIIENVAYDSDTFTTKVIVTVRANDMESGVYAYSVSSSQSTPTTWKKLDLSENLVSFDAEITTNGTWYLFVRDLVGNVTMYDKAITIKNIDNAAPVIKLFDIVEDYTFTAEVFIQVKAEDDTGVTEILLSNQLLTTSQAESSAGWIPFTETILYTLPNKDGEHTVYAWVRDSVGKISEMASDSTMLLQKYVGNNGINSTSFKFLVKDENYDFANKLTGANIKIAVKDDNGDVTYSTDYGMNITSITLPTVYGPQQEGTQIMSGEYYTITVDNLRGQGTVYLIFDDSAIVDMAGNKLESTEVKTDVMVELNAPTISLGATEIQVSDAENNLVQAIKINDKTVLLTGGKITYAKLESDYGITLKTGDRIEAYDKCGNASAVEVQ